MFRSAVAILELGDGSGMLFEVRPKRPGLLNGGKAGLFGGGVDHDETPQEGLLRELTEELQDPNGEPIPVHKVEQVWRGEVPDGNGSNITREVSLFLITLGYAAGAVQLRPDLEQTGTGLRHVELGAELPPDTTGFAVRAVAAHMTGDYQSLSAAYRPLH